MVFWDTVLAVVWAGVIFGLSHIPHLESGLDQDIFLRKGAHIVEYAVLTVLIIRALRHHAPTPKSAIAGGAWLAFAYAWFDEVHQLFVQGRSGSLADVGIDLIGIVLGAFIWTIFLWYRQYSKQVR